MLKMKLIVRLKSTNTTEELIMLQMKSLNQPKKSQPSPKRLLNLQLILRIRLFNLISWTNKKLILDNKDLKMKNNSRDSKLKLKVLLMLLKLLSLSFHQSNQIKKSFQPLLNWIRLEIPTQSLPSCKLLLPSQLNN